MIESAAVQGMTRLGYNASELRLKSEPEALTDQVRVIISDLRLLRETYPAIAEDSLFLEESSASELNVKLLQTNLANSAQNVKSVSLVPLIEGKIKLND